MFDDNYNIDVPRSISNRTIKKLIKSAKKNLNIEITLMAKYTEEQRKALEKDIRLT